ncbi:MAG: SUMF1/EgtB/PvdO family nonheme iron enzyme, partial [Planctomycetota bacterium]|nr:SUMF1/EgtB/PvdO family nonheme iron enzyme [Planctomycetota bacterium]
MSRNAVGFCVLVCLMLVGLSHPAWSQAPAEKPGKLKNSIGIEFANIPAGKFLMGTPATEKERSQDETQHEVTLTQGFRMGVHEVTQAQ